jgi:hypothetical protein
MSFTNCLANFAGLLAPMAAGYLTDKRVSWKGNRWTVPRLCALWTWDTCWSISLVCKYHMFCAKSEWSLGFCLQANYY